MEKHTYCTCHETLITYSEKSLVPEGARIIREDSSGIVARVPKLKFHSCEYIRQRNKFVPSAASKAEREADEDAINAGDYSRIFNRVFAGEMEAAQ